ncbi:MAG: hypothetical protein J1F12_08800 [Muribaculaceae bacterium]|nr:hypothetical protein [Muribaculaceae bacterium]
MRYLKYIFLLAPVLFFSCTDDALVEENVKLPEFNIEEFSEGYSLAFDMKLDPMGNETGSRAETSDDLLMQEWENYLNPEEFRVLFFDNNDRFLFESKSRWLTQIESQDGGNRWRVGIPVFQYLGDNYDDTPGHEGEKLDEDDQYNWDKIVEIMRKEGFKIAVLANRPLKVTLPDLDDYAANYSYLKDMDFAKLGPFWTSKNSIATDDVDDSDVATVFDLHHCQFDPVYFSKSIGKSATDVYGDRWYDLIMDYNNHTEEITAKGNKHILNNAPWMGAASSWVSVKRTRNVTSTNSSGNQETRNIRYYRLPNGQYYSNPETNGDPLVYSVNEHDGDATGGKIADDPQYIPMYGIQEFAPLTSWVKGTTFYLSERTGSQTADYNYSPISLLRSIVKLELRIAKKDKNNKDVKIDNKWAQLWFNNYMARCEPMDVSTPTNLIWKKDHSSDCEWLRIKKYGSFINNGNFKNWLSWYYGIWQESGWDFNEHSSGITVPGKVELNEVYDYPRVFNPLTQRLQGTLITDCYLPTDKFHRWVIYCGERNIVDPVYLGIMDDPTAAYFRIPVRRVVSNKEEEEIFNLPITDYLKDKNPIYNNYTYEGSTARKHLVEAGENWANRANKENMAAETSSMKQYFVELKTADNDLLPFPLLRNHCYIIEVIFGDNYDLNVKVLNADIRNVGGIEFN